MNARAEVTDAAETAAPGTAIVALVQENPGLALLDEKKFDAFYDAIRTEVMAHVPDLTTAKGRDAIKSLAFKVVKSKTALDDAGKKLTEDARAQIAKVDAARRNIRTKLDELRDEVRRPLDEWEEGEKARLAKVDETISYLRTAAKVDLGETSAEVELRLGTVGDVEITTELFADRADEALGLKEGAIASLQASAARLKQAEAERAELERLRAEAAERDRLEAERRAQEERARAEEERKSREAEAARLRAEEEARIAADREAAAAAAAERAREEAARQAEERERAHAAELERTRREAEEKARRAAEDQRRAEEAERERVAAEERRKAENKAHQGRVMAAAKTGLMKEAGLDEEAAKRVVLAIKAGAIPHVVIQF